MDIDAIQQRARDLAQVSLDDGGSAAAFAARVAIESAQTRVAIIEFVFDHLLPLIPGRFDGFGAAHCQEPEWRTKNEHAKLHSWLAARNPNRF
jgi:hypothetical protein